MGCLTKCHHFAASPIFSPGSQCDELCGLMRVSATPKLVSPLSSASGKMVKPMMTLVEEQHHREIKPLLHQDTEEVRWWRCYCLCLDACILVMVCVWLCHDCLHCHIVCDLHCQNDVFCCIKILRRFVDGGVIVCVLMRVFWSWYVFDYVMTYLSSLSYCMWL